MKSIVHRHKKTNVKTTRKNKTHKKSSINRSNKYRRMRNRKNRRISKKKKYKGGNNDITCCMCGDKNLTIENTLVPLKCSRINGIKAHRICRKKCWFQKFAKEDNNHTCPGCINDLPLTNIESTVPKNEKEVIDLT